MTHHSLPEHGCLRGLRLTQDDVASLTTRHKKHVWLEPRPDGWDLHAASYVGTLVLPSGTSISVTPKIPVANLHYMVSCAFGHARFDGNAKHDVNGCSPLDMYAALLWRHVQVLFSQGFNKSYAVRTDDIPSIRGKFHPARSAVTTRRFRCTFDEHTHSTLENQILKATLHNLMRAPLPEPLCQRLSFGYRLMAEVKDTTLSDDLFNALTYNRSNRRYQLALELCEVLYRNASYNDASGGKTFAAFMVDMNKLFETFVLKSLQHAMPNDRVRSSKKYNWATALEPNLHLPALQPDIVIENKMVVDAKYYAGPLNEHDKLRSANLYQLAAYMNAYDQHGMLVYPKTDTDFNHTYLLNEHTFTVKTVDLSGSVSELQSSVNELVATVNAVNELNMRNAVSV